MSSRTWTKGFVGVLLLVTGCGESDHDEALNVAVRFKEALLDPRGDPCNFVEPALVAQHGGEACRRTLRPKYRRTVRGPVRVVRVWEDSDFKRASIRLGREA